MSDPTIHHAPWCAYPGEIHHSGAYCNWCGGDRTPYVESTGLTVHFSEQADDGADVERIRYAARRMGMYPEAWVRVVATTYAREFTGEAPDA